MKEDDICELLKFERKQIRSRISILRMDKFLQVRLKMETGPDGKAAKVNYYYINYKTFVNVVKYKLDLMRKRMETEERDATSRASFKCPNCNKTFTDLEVGIFFGKNFCNLISIHLFRLINYLIFLRASFTVHSVVRLSKRTCLPCRKRIRDCY